MEAAIASALCLASNISRDPADLDAEIRLFLVHLEEHAPQVVQAGIVEPWTTSPVEGQINRVKAIKRQMYGQATYPLLKQRVLIAA